MTSSLTITLGFAGSLRIVYPNGKSIDLPLGEAEARLVEILEGFRRDYKTILQERQKAPTELPKRFSIKAAELTLADLNL